MRKFITTILALLYLTVSTGATVHTHYCMDKLVDVSLLNDNEVSFCDNCGMKSNAGIKSDCCKKQHQLIKLEKDQKSVDNSLQIHQVASHAIAVSNHEIFIPSFTSLKEVSPSTYLPHLNFPSTIYKRNCVFRI